MHSPLKDMSHTDKDPEGKGRAEQSLDRELVESYARQFGLALHRYFARRLSNRDICEDLVQDVFTKIAGRRATGEIENPEAYLMQTASRVLANHLSAKQRRSEDQHFEYQDFAHSPEGFSAERVYIGREDLNELILVLREMPERTRDIYLLCRYDGKKRSEVAARLGISVSAVDKHLIRASKKITEVFGDRL